MQRFKNRQEAGRLLAQRLKNYEDDARVLVLGLMRGGVVVAHEVATAIEAPMDVFLVRKVGVPGHPEVAMAALGSGGVRVLNDALIQRLGISQAQIDKATAAEETELNRREELYRRHKPPLDLTGETVILVDDGLATGATMRAAVRAMKAQNTASVIVAVPVAEPDALDSIKREADKVVCLKTPSSFVAVSHWYEAFEQVSDEQVCTLLASARPVLPGG